MAGIMVTADGPKHHGSSDLKTRTKEGENSESSQLGKTTPGGKWSNQKPSKHGACQHGVFSSTEKAYDSVDAAGPCQAPKAQSGSGIVRLSLASLISLKPLENTNFHGW